MGIFKLCFLCEFKFLALKKIPRLAPFAVGMEFAIQISPLPNFIKKCAQVFSSVVLKLGDIC